MNEIRDYVDLKYGEVFCEKYDYNTMLVSKRESVSHFNIFKLKKEEDFVLFSEEANKFLRKNDFEIKVDDSMGINIKNFIRRNREDLLPFLQWKFRESSFYGRDFFNEKKLCLSQDLLISEEKQLEVHCHKGSYYDTYLTNQICGKKLCSNKDNKIIADAMQFMPIDENKEGKKVFRSITDSMMNNEIGISTVGITRDNYIVLWKQNRRAQSSNDLLVPTGSGSCDWSDKKNLRFKETIERAMQRELLEESGIKKQSIKYGKSGKSIGETKVIGFFRWLTRGGKPEFVGITKLNVCYTALVENQKEVYIGKSYYFSTLDDLKNEVKKIFKEDNLSTPLYMNLKCIQSLLEEDNEELKNFLKIN